MNGFATKLLLFSAVLLCTQPSPAFSENASGIISQLEFTAPESDSSLAESYDYSFDGHTTHWESYRWNRQSCNGLFHASRTDPITEFGRLKDDIGNELLLDELWIQRGLISRLAEKQPEVLNGVPLNEIEEHLAGGDVLLRITDRDPAAEAILSKLPQNIQYRRNRAFYLQDHTRTLFVIACHTKEETVRLHGHITEAVEIVRNYSLSKGVAGIHTNYYLITPSVGHHPFELVNMLCQLGCSWMMVSGFNDFLIPELLEKSLQEIGVSFPCISGQFVNGGVLYGMSRYPDVQDNTLDQSLDWKEKHNGYFFADLSSAGSEQAERFDGYIANSPGDQGKLDEIQAAFLTNAQTIDTAVPPCMILFHPKATGETLTKETIMKAILERRAVGVFENGAMLGPKELTVPLRVLLLDGDYLEKQFTKEVSLDSRIDGQFLDIVVPNRSNRQISSTLTLSAPDGVRIGENVFRIPITLSAWEIRRFHLPVTCTAGAFGRDNPIAVILDTPDGIRQSLARLESPRPVEIHPLILEAPGKISYPATLWNYSDTNKVHATITVCKSGDERPVWTAEQDLEVPRYGKRITHFQFSLKPGDYLAKVTAQGTTVEGQIAVRAQKGKAAVTEEDQNGDGIPEIVMENNVIRATLLLFGGRVIEYTVKSKNENLLFKLWPEKPPWAGEPRGVRAFYPHGGLEEFIGYPFIGGLRIYQYEIMKDRGEYVRVKLWIDVHGSKIEKIVTLFAGSPVLEARYALNDMTPSINVIGINPLVQVGPSTGPEDIYSFPVGESEILQKRPELERYYGATLFLREGWTAAYDTEMDISLVVGFPVNDAVLMHLWNNHPDNTPTPYYYTELQPWVQLKHRTTTYFTYYLFGQTGDWKPAVEKFRALGVVTTRH
ncbi:MAG TPA: hypothetical protein PLQ35_07295 [bacterium]|nr:hypothetical protein [bacterium]HQL62083.1 hypothetical protein [bacterium]